MAGAINATTPLCTFAFGLLGRSVGDPAPEPFGRRRVIGLGLGFAGAVVLLAPWRSGLSGTLGGSVACLVASAAYGLSFVYMGRRLVGRGIPPLVLAAGQLIAATGWAVAALPFIGRSAVHPHPEVIGAVAAIGVGGTGLAYVLNYRLVCDEGPAATSTVTYLMPLVSVLLGASFLDEPVGANLVVGTAVVLVGVFLAQRRADSPLPRAVIQTPAPTPAPTP
jgi:drug/metabolite transporter (DMT)-like permease